MEESQKILLRSLESSGVRLPPLVSSIGDLSSPSLFSVCAQSLRLIDAACPIPTSLPDSMAERFRICTQLASALTDLGYVGHMSFHKLLYPSEEDLYKLVRFLVERLSESSEERKNSEENDISATTGEKEEMTSKDWMVRSNNQWNDSKNYQKVGTSLNDLTVKTEELDPLNTNSIEAPMIDKSAFVDISRSGIQDSSKEELMSVGYGEQSIEESSMRSDGCRHDQTAGQRDDKHVSKLQQKLAALKEQSSKMRNEIEKLQSREKVLMEEVSAKTLELQDVEEEHDVLKAVAEMVFDDQQPVEFYLDQLNERVDKRKHNLVELETQWGASMKSLEEKKKCLEDSLYATIPEAWEKLQKLEEVEVETQSILSEIRKREEEHSKLSADLEKQPKLAPRISYVQRIIEITKNSRKQDADIDRILKETRELQIESNSIQERLHRTYAVVDETVFREAKKDAVGRKAYRLLTSIHETFEQVSEKILTADRTRREVAEYEAKLASMASRRLDIGKLQADLDAIRKENEYLEQRLQDN
ncbi:uncharacterized protein LOC131167771 [Malania oleifera]|uniref:uncharacterized protein LOC131167771 n=1 Tax=Malania oleifera TaxID=397392 RepID=UPI0025AE064F|nr:uncharacterized protein LOC131167771 [Malania oleifera]